jgi:uncharacterized protein with PQ loop repeat
MNLGFLHLHTRKRISVEADPYPHPSFIKRHFDRIMYAVALVAPAILLPQVYRIFAYQDVGGLSLFTAAALACFNLLWIMYGMLHQAIPIVVANTAFFMLNVASVYAILIFR